MSKLAYTLREAAAESGHTEDQMRAAIRDGKLPARMTGAQLIILATDLNQFLSRLPTLHQISAAARAEAATKEADTKRARGRAIAEQAMGKGPASQPMSAAEREKEQRNRVAREKAAMQRGRDLVAKIKGQE